MVPAGSRSVVGSSSLIMAAARLPLDEAARLDSLHALELLDTAPEPAYDDLVRLARELCATPMGLVTLVDEHRQWFKAREGVPLTETSRDVSFCAHTILDREQVLVVDDALADPRFCDNPLVAEGPRIRFYAGAPIVDQDGRALGTLCVMDVEPRTLTSAQRECLQALARQASVLILLRAKATTAARIAREHSRLSVEARLKQQHGSELLDLVLRGDRMGLWDLHLPTGEWTINARELAMLGYFGVAAPPALGTLQEMIHPDDWPAFETAMHPHVDGKTSFFECTHRLRHRDGHWIWVLGRAVIVERDVWGTPIRIVGTHVDVTETHLRDEEQRRNTERLELAMSGGDIGMWDWHTATDTVVRNEAWARMFGYDPVETETGDGLWRRTVHPDDLEPARALMERHLRGETPMYETEVRMRHKDGHWLWILDRARVVERDAAGQVKRVVGTIMNITARRESIAALEAATEMLTRTGAMARVGGWELEVPSGAVTWSTEVYRIHDLEPGDRPDLAQAIEFYAAGARRTLEDAIERAIADGTPFDLELPLVTARGRDIWVRSRGVADRVNGVTARLHGSIQDITDRKRAEQALIDSERRIRTMADSLPALIAHVDRDERYTFVNAHLLRFLKKTQEEVLGQKVATIRGEKRYEQFRGALHEAFTGKTVSFEAEGPAFGRHYHTQSHFIPDRDETGRVNGVYAMTLDITDRKRAELLRAETDERLRAITDNLPALIAELDPEWRFRFCNETYRTWLDIDPASVQGRHIVDVVSNDYFKGCEPHLVRAFRGEKVRFEQTLDLPIGLRTLQTTYLPHFDAQGAVTGVYGMTHDITDQKSIERRLNALARIDPLTGLPNRRQFEERVADSMARSRRNGTSMAVLYLDIDRFKSINDTLGHAGGDEVLKQVAERLRASVRTSDVVARLAGDEFVVVLEHLATDDEANHIAAKVVAAMRPAFRVDGSPFLATLSAGVAMFHGDDEDTEVLLSRADRALYTAKSTGRNRVSVANA